MDIEKQLAAALQRVPMMDKQALLTLRENASRKGDVAATLIAAIDQKLEAFESDGGMAKHRLEFARCMLRKMEREPVGRRVPSMDLFQRARTEDGSNAFAIWMEGNTARRIPLTKALEDVLPEFPNLKREKDGSSQSDRVFYVRTR